MPDEIRRLIRVRTRKGASFKRDGFGKKSQISSSWRKPRGLHNKQRKQKKAKGNLPKPGFGSPIAVRSMHPSGFFEVLVHTVDDLEGLDPKVQAVRIASTVGNRKRMAIQDKAITAGLRVLNAKAVKPVEKPGPSVETEEEDREEPKTTKEVPRQKVKPVTEKRKETPKAKKTPKKSPKEPVSKEITEPEDAKPSEEPEMQKPKSPKAKAKKQTGTEEKPKKTAKPKPEPSKEAKAPKKAVTKPAGKPRKKTGTGVKDDE